MNDSRIGQALALADDARCILSDLDDELPALPESHYIAAARAAINRAITELNKIKPTPTQGDAA